MLAKAAKRILPCSKVYAFGGAAEDRLTVLSDIDVLIVTSKKITDSERGIKAEILRVAEDLGFPWYYPIDIHIACTEDLENYRKHGKLIEIA
ncbi:MAG: nucleotidyltransferase domain-containing protein [Candidatus Methanodesulfokora sp.]